MKYVPNGIREASRVKAGVLAFRHHLRMGSEKDPNPGREKKGGETNSPGSCSMGDPKNYSPFGLLLSILASTSSILFAPINRALKYPLSVLSISTCFFFREVWIN
jgi:hypothetical protein